MNDPIDDLIEAGVRLNHLLYERIGTKQSDGISWSQRYASWLTAEFPSVDHSDLEDVLLAAHVAFHKALALAHRHRVTT